jgi:hypothetical protein
MIATSACKFCDFNVKGGVFKKHRIMRNHMKVNHPGPFALLEAKEQELQHQLIELQKEYGDAALRRVF